MCSVCICSVPTALHQRMLAKNNVCGLMKFYISGALFKSLASQSAPARCSALETSLVLSIQRLARDTDGNEVRKQRESAVTAL